MSILFSLIGIVSLIALWITMDKSTKLIRALTEKLKHYHTCADIHTAAIEAALDGDNRMSERRKTAIRIAINKIRAGEI